MTWRNYGPGGVETAPAPETLYHLDHIPAFGRSQPARCELHGIHLVDAFPRQCPFATVNPLETIGQLQDVAWRELGRGETADADPAAALELMDRIEICGGCIDRNLSHRTVRLLRRELGVSR